MKKMQTMYKYTLHKNSTKHICPKCDKKRFVRYIDIEKNEYISYDVGRCDREVNCGYHYPPKEYFNKLKRLYTPILKEKIKLGQIDENIDYHKAECLAKTQASFNKNNLIIFLKSKFELVNVNKMINDYKIGTAQNNYYGTVFWQIGDDQKIRAGKIINYDKLGKRTKYVNWVHSIQIKRNQIENFDLKQCLFGLHLLHRSTKNIAIVESEKTACIMSLLFDKYEWMATGSLNGLNKEKLKPLKERRIILYPDLGIDTGNGSPYIQWSNKCKFLNEVGFNISVSDLLEVKSSNHDRIKGLDIADYFIDNYERQTKKIQLKKYSNFRSFYMKNTVLKTLVNVFELTDEQGRSIDFE